MIKNCILLIFISVVFPFLGGSVLADELPLKVFPEGIELKMPIEVENEKEGADKTGSGREKISLKRNGYGLCEWGFSQVDLYWAALYLEKKSSDPEKIIESKGAKRIHLHLVHDLTRAQLQKAYSATFKVNAGKDLPRYQKRVDRLTGMMKDLEEGDSLVFTCIPGTGLEVEVGGKEAGTIEGEDFSRMFFTLYLGSNPPDENLKKGLLGPKRKK